MPTFVLTGPNGKEYEVDGPEGATPQQAFEILQNKLGAAPSTRAPTQKDMSPPLVQAADAALATVSGMAAKPVSDVAGTLAIPLHAAGAIQTEPAEVQSKVRAGLTHEPTTEGGKMVTRMLSAPGEWWDRLAQAAEQKVAGPDPGPARAVAGYAARGAVEQAPMLAGAKAPAAAGSASRALRAGAEGEMQRALKPTIQEVRKGQAQSAINTMLDIGINVSKGGLGKIQTRVAELNQGIQDVVDRSPAIVDRDKVSSYLQGTIDRFQKQVLATDDVAQIQKAWDEFTNVQPKDIPVKRAQELKTGTYSQLKNKSYGELKAAQIEAQKDLARGLKEEIAKAVPEVRPLNAEESKLLTALPMVERRALHAANENLAGFAWLAHDVPHFAAYLADKSTLFHSLVARMLNTASKATTGTSGPVAGTAMSLPPTDARERARRRRERVQKQRQQESQ